MSMTDIYNSINRNVKYEKMKNCTSQDIYKYKNGFDLPEIIKNEAEQKIEEAENQVLIDIYIHFKQDVEEAKKKYKNAMERFDDFMNNINDYKKTRQFEVDVKTKLDEGKLWQ